MRAHHVLLAAALALVACSKSIGTQDQPGTLAPVELPTDHPVLTPLPDPEANGGHAGRAPRRISVAQLKASIITVTGRQWTQIDNLASSLGQADYALTVSDATEPNLVFAKFLDDGAREVCLNVARDDLARAQDLRVLWPEVPGTSRDFTTLDTTGVKDVDLARSLRLAGIALDIARSRGKPGSHFIA